MKIAITTLGCKINQYDSAVIQSRLEEAHSFVPFDEPADCYIINTCTVTDRADWEARQLVRRAKRSSPSAKVMVTGCYAQVSPEEVARLPGVDYVVGLNRLDDLLRFVDPSTRAPAVAGGHSLGIPPENRGVVLSERSESKDNGSDAPGLPRGLHEPAAGAGATIAVSDVQRERGVPVLGTRALPGHTRAFLKIQEGCNYSCTYCIIPIARGLSRSVTPREVLEQVRRLAGAGYLELVLTGIHLGGYGQDLTPKTDLTSLVEKIAASGLVPRLRLSSLDPREVPDRLLDLIAGSEVICPHLHICAQGGNDEVLKQMRRNYDTAYYGELVCKIRDRIPDAALGSDIIVAFPGESDAAFEASLEFFASLPLTYFHVFPYSKRRGTVAISLPDHVPGNAKKQRARRMRELGARKKEAFCRSFLGKRLAVLVEAKADRCSSGRRGFSENYLPVAVRNAEGFVNRVVTVQLDGFAGGWLSGRAMDGAPPHLASAGGISVSP